MKELFNTGIDLGLEYKEEIDALVGNIKGYSIAVRENLETGSYGCLLWVKKGTDSYFKSVEDYLTERQRIESELIRNFRVAERGAAVALTRTDDDFRNVTNLKHFLNDLVYFLSVSSYVNCCSECGSTDEVAIYASDNMITQSCKACGSKYKKMITKPAPAASPSPVYEAPIDDISDLLFSEQLGKGNTDAVSDETAVPGEINDYSDSSAAEKDNNDFSELIADEKPELTEIIPERQEDTSEDKNSFDSLLLSDEPEPKNEPPKSELFEQAEREFREEQAKLDKTTNNDISINELVISESGLIEIKDQEEENDSSVAVTEIRDDSNDGEYIDVTESRTKVFEPTVTTGHEQLKAVETPLERDGSVPLVNPDLKRVQNQAADGENAFIPMGKGTYENINKQSDIEQAGYATAENMIDRDADDFGIKRQQRTAPPPYNPAAYENLPQSTYRPYVSNTKSNLLMGLIGALTLGAIGTGVSVMITSTFNVISYWCGVIIVAAVFFGYYLAGKNLDNKGIAVSAILSVLLTVAGVVVISAIDMQSALSETFGVEVSLFSAIEWTIYCAKNVETVRNDIIHNLAFSGLATLLADALAVSISIKRNR